jgi:aryl-alcohol dehydrogenase-like predicted oxidoreductase
VYVQLPNTELTVSRLGFGAEPLGGTDWGNVDERQTAAAVEKALELGVTLFDTADVYGLGRSEEALSRALGERRHDVVIVTKFGVNWRGDGSGGRAKTSLDSSPKHVVRALENSLRRLRLDVIPLYLTHWPDPDTPLSATIAALLRCQEQGLIRYFGVSNFSPPLLEEARALAPLAALELPYNLIERDAEEALLPLCRKLGVGALTYGPLAQGLLTGKYGLKSRFGPDDRRHRLPHFQGERLQQNLRLVERLKDLAHAYGKTPAQVALRWALHHPAVSCTIAGAKTPTQVLVNAGALSFALSREDLEYLSSPSGKDSQRNDHVTS